MPLAAPAISPRAGRSASRAVAARPRSSRATAARAMRRQRASASSPGGGAGQRLSARLAAVRPGPGRAGATGAPTRGRGPSRCRRGSWRARPATRAGTAAPRAGARGRLPACRMVEQRGGLPVALLGASGVRRGRRGSHGQVPPGKHARRGVVRAPRPSRSRAAACASAPAEVTEPAERLQPDQPPEYLEVDQAVPRGERHDLSADLVAPRGEPRPRE